VVAIYGRKEKEKEKAMAYEKEKKKVWHRHVVANDKKAIL